VSEVGANLQQENNTPSIQKLRISVTTMYTDYTRIWKTGWEKME